MAGMGLPQQTTALLKAARQMYHDLPADAVLLVTETNLDWAAVKASLAGCRLLVAAQSETLTQRLRDLDGMTLLEIEQEPKPIEERISLALLKAIANEQLHPAAERDIRDRRVREQIKDLAQLEGAILIGRDGVAVAACIYLDVSAEGITLSKGLGSRHWSAAAISRKTQAIAVVVSQSSGTVRIFQNGEVVLHIEPLARPHIWQPLHLETQEGDGLGAASAGG